MAYNKTTYTASASQTIFNIPFSRLTNDYLFVGTIAVGETEIVVKNKGTDYSILDNTVVFQDGLAQGTKVVLWRHTTREPLVDFTNVKNLTSSNLGVLTTQVANISEEVESDINSINAVLDSILLATPTLDPEAISNSYLELLSRTQQLEINLLDVSDKTVMAYGAKGDGITDDSDAFIAAITALPAEGGTIFVPANKTFLLKKRLIQSGDSNSLKEITIKGEGTAKRRTSGPTVDYGNILVDADGVSNFTLIHTNARQFNLIGLNCKSLGSKTDGLNTKFFYADRTGAGTLSYGYSIIDKVLLSNFSGDNISINGVVNVSVSNYNCFSTGGRALSVRNNLDGLVSTTLFLHNCYWSSCSGDGLYLDQAVDCYLDGLIVEYSGNTTNNTGIYSITSNVVTCTITGHTLTTGDAVPVIFTSGGNSGNNITATVTVTDANTFTFSQTASNTTGNVYIVKNQRAAINLYKASRIWFKNLYLEANYRNFLLLDSTAGFNNWDVYAENSPSIFAYIGLDTAQRGFNHHTTNSTQFYHRQGSFDNRRGNTIYGTYALVSNVITFTSTLSDYTTTTPHGLSDGQRIFINFTTGGRSNSDDVFAITRISSTQFSIAFTASDTTGQINCQTTYLTPSFTTLQMNSSGELCVTKRDSTGTGNEKRILTGERVQRTITGAVSTSSHTLTESWNGQTILINHTAGVVVTLPVNLAVGSHWRIVQYNTGQVTFTPASGATLVSRPGHTKTNGRYALVELEVLASSSTTGEYLLTGDTSA